MHFLNFALATLIAATLLLAPLGVRAQSNDWEMSFSEVANDDIFVFHFEGDRFFTIYTSVERRFKERRFMGSGDNMSQREPEATIYVRVSTYVGGRFTGSKTRWLRVPLDQIWEDDESVYFDAGGVEAILIRDGNSGADMPNSPRVDRFGCTRVSPTVGGSHDNFGVIVVTDPNMPVQGVFQADGQGYSTKRWKLTEDCPTSTGKG